MSFSTRHLALVFAFFIFAGTDLASALEIRPQVSLGSGVMFERGNDNLSDSSRLPLSFAAGARFNSWTARLEYASFRTSDGNQTVAVAREVENLLIWGTYDFSRDASWTPYVGVGTGAARTNVQTSMGASREVNKGSFQGTLAAAAGVRGFWTPRFAVRPEVRVESSEAYKIKDARAGVFIQLDLVFN